MTNSDPPASPPPSQAKLHRAKLADASKHTVTYRTPHARAVPHRARSSSQVSLRPETLPASLCPYCDQPLPENPSDALLDLLRTARAKSRPRPRRNNPHGLKASMAVYIGVCERHRFETKVLPRAIRSGWPTKIDFDLLPDRVKNHRQALDAVLADPRASVFFREANDLIAKVGARVAESPMGQYAAFQRFQPGYYGERGALLLLQTLAVMYPVRDLRAISDRFAPLSLQTFQYAVLLPEAALALIKEDMGTSAAGALTTMRASSHYGSMMFCDDDDADGDTVGDMLMREFAMRRRKEIEEEEEEERDWVA
ncbi:hypothetical protein AURDEDRAFT_131165 [Auricularia subglabra TFB-10046 SS5]|uniref:Restriction of telomere capping protein 4 n=1 Tax=Auricularia subglabra (strain TFB-10046 / SS5) TaxID=717982 RepID=J0LD35_AURST|nr:hypothetical protein AURDEDRAFT_131165 [Auricularia subglabra TFB-10046 SS5]